MSLELVANDGSSSVLPLFASTNEIRTIKIMLGSTKVELSTTLQANSPTSLDVALKQQQDPVAPLPSSTDATAATSLPQEIAPSPQPEATKASTTSATETTEDASAKKKKKKGGRGGEMRNWLLMVATVFAAMTYQGGLSPPGGSHEGESPSPGYSSNATSSAKTITPSLINATIVCNASSNMATPGNESHDHPTDGMFFKANAIAFVYSMGAIVVLLSDTLCDKLEGRKDLKAFMVINAFIIVFAYSSACISLGPLIGMCVMVAAYGALYVKKRIIGKLTQFGRRITGKLTQFGRRITGKLTKFGKRTSGKLRQFGHSSGERENVGA